MPKCSTGPGWPASLSSHCSAAPSVLGSGSKWRTTGWPPSTVTRCTSVLASSRAGCGAPGRRSTVQKRSLCRVPCCTTTGLPWWRTLKDVTSMVRNGLPLVLGKPPQTRAGPRRRSRTARAAASRAAWRCPRRRRPSGRAGRPAGGSTGAVVARGHGRASEADGGGHGPQCARSARAASSHPGPSWRALHSDPEAPLASATCPPGSSHRCTAVGRAGVKSDAKAEPPSARQARCRRG